MNNDYLDDITSVIAGKGKIIHDNIDQLIIHKHSRIALDDELILNGNRVGENSRNSILRMEEGSELIVNGKFSFMYGADILLFKNARLVLGRHILTIIA